jgi:hypothetical protein
LFFWTFGVVCVTILVVVVVSFFSFFPPHSTTRFFPGGTWRDTRSRRHTHTQNQLRKKKIPTAPIIDFRSATSTSRAPLCKKKTTTTTHFCFVFVFVFPMEIKICGGLLGDDDKSWQEDTPFYISRFPSL